MDAHSSRQADASLCDSCALQALTFCRTLRRLLDDRSHPIPPQIRSERTARARQTIYREGDPTAGAYVVCAGWASRYIQLPDGRRQILSIILPGDLVSPAALFRSRLPFSVEALTPVRYSVFDRGTLHAIAEAAPTVTREWAGLCIDEAEQGDRLLLDLGRRMADERMARLVLHLMDRLTARNLVRDGAFAFPLRQQDIADAMGLTPVHVSRVINAFRKAALIELAGGNLKIVDLPGLRQAASVPNPKSAAF